MQIEQFSRNLQVEGKGGEESNTWWAKILIKVLFKKNPKILLKTIP